MFLLILWGGFTPTHDWCVNVTPPASCWHTQSISNTISVHSADGDDDVHRYIEFLKEGLRRAGML